MDNEKYRELDALKVPLQGTLLIEASAGTGKTYTISTLFIRLLLKGIEVPRILVVTYTNAATAELINRLRLRVQEVLSALEYGEKNDIVDSIIGPQDQSRAKTVLRKAMSDFDQASIFTIHSFCFRTLQQFAFESGVLFDMDMGADQVSLLEEIAVDFWVREMYHCDELFYVYLQKKGIKSPRELIDFIRKPLADPTVTILPKHPDSVNTEDAERAFLESYKSLREYLNDGQPLREVRELITSKAVKGIKRGKDSYRVNNLGKYLNKISSYFNFPTPTDFFTTSVKPQQLENIRKNKDENIDDPYKIMRFSREMIDRKLQMNGNPLNHPFFDKLSHFISCSVALLEQYHQRFLGFTYSLIEYARREANARKEESAVHYFDDLLVKLYQALKSNESQKLVHQIREHFDAALIDEFQDTDHIQFDIFSRLFGGDKPLVLVGDPKQSIYAFRGADVYSYLKAARSEEVQHYTLSTNYRSDPLLVKAVNRLYSRCPSPFFEENIQYRTVKERAGAKNQLHCGGKPAVPFVFVHTDAKKEELRQFVVAETINLLVSHYSLQPADGPARPIQFSDIAILVRTNAEAVEMMVALNNYDIPVSSALQVDIFDTREALELFRLLRAVLTPNDISAIKAALITSLGGFCAEDIAAWEDDSDRMEKWLLTFRHWHTLWASRGIAVLIDSLTGDWDGLEQPLYARLLKRSLGFRTVANVRQLFELLIQVEKQARFGMFALYDWFARSIAGNRQLLDEEQRTIRLERDGQSVIISSIHKAKGLEYPFVILPPIRTPSKSSQKMVLYFHDPEHDWKPVMDIGSHAWDEHQRYMKGEQIAESTRLLYVALTRAKHGVITFLPQDKAKGDTPWQILLTEQASNIGEALETVASNGTTHRTTKKKGNRAASRNAKKMMTYIENTLLADSADAIALRSPHSVEEADITSLKSIDRKVLLETHPPRITPRRAWKIGSYSGLTAAQPIEEKTDLLPTEALMDEERIRWDEGDDMEFVEFELPIPEPSEGTAVATSEQPGNVTLSGMWQSRVTLADFPKGAYYGRFFHDLLESLDFTAGDDGQWEAVLQRHLQRYRIDKAMWQNTLLCSLSQIISTPLAGDGSNFSLSAISSQYRLNELEFFIPLHLKAQEPTFTVDSLRRVLEAHLRDSPHAHFLQALESLRFKGFIGYLRGFMDLLLTYQGKYYLVDYKTNHLGDHYSMYTSESLERAMAEHLYFLQYYLYLVALNQFLKQRDPDYNYTQDFGGVFYLFLRGMHPEFQGQTGVFYHKPDAALLTDLHNLLIEGRPY